MAAGKIAQPQSANPNAHELFHFVADFIKHPSNLAIDSLAKKDAQSCRFDGMHGFDPRTLSVEHYALMQFRGKSRVPGAIESHLIFLFDFVARMGQALRQMAVIGEEKEAFGLGVEPADVEETRQVRREEMEDCIARIRIAPRGDETRRFMQHDVEPALTVDEFAAHFDVVAFRGLRAEIGANAAIDGYAASGDQLITVTSRTEPGRGQKSVQAHGKTRG